MKNVQICVGDFQIGKGQGTCFKLFTNLKNKKPYVDHLISVCGIYQDRILLYVATMKQYCLVLGLKTPHLLLSG